MARAGAAGTLYAIVGPDSYRAEQALERILSQELGLRREGVLQVLYGDETGWGRLVEIARTGSLFVSRRAVVVRGADALRGGEEEMAAYVEDPSPDVSLVLLAAKPDRRRVAWKRFLERASVTSAEPLKGRALRAYVAEQLLSRDLRLAPEAVEELIERVGQDLRRLMGEVDKLEAFGRGRPALSAEDVAGVLGRSMAPPLYRLSDAVSGRDAAVAVELIEGLLEEGEEAPRLLGTLHRALRQVRAAVAMKAARAGHEQMAARLLPPQLAFKLPALLQAAARWTEPELRRALDALGRADRGLKRGADARAALTAAVTEACRGPAAALRPSRPGR